ncbi:hypothetical protein GEMRC1_002385 [Eukaryota sp. GEM-RC1]
MLLVPVNSAMCDLTADGRHWGLIVLIISSPTSHILFIDPTYVEDDYAREFPVNQTPVAPSSSNLFTIVSKIYSVLSMCETRNIEFIPSNIKHTLTDSGFCVLEYIELLMNLDQSVVIRWTDVKELLGNTTIAVHESRSKILEHFETFSPVELSRVSASPISGKRLASTKASTGLSTKKRKAKISDIPSPRGSPLIQRNKFRTTSSLVSTGDTPIRKTHRRMSTLESSEVPPSELPPKIKASIMSNVQLVQEDDDDIETVEGEAEDQLEVKRDSSVDPIVSIFIEIIDHNEFNEKHLFSHGNFDTTNLDLCTLHISDSESSMLKNFISFITQHCPRLFVSYDFHLDTFPFLVSRCQVLKINTTFTFPEFKPYIPFWFNKWCKETTFGPFFSLDLNAVLKNFYVFTGGRFLENVVQIFLEMNNFSKNETVKRLEELNHDSDPDEVQLVNNVQNLHGIIDSINVLVPDNPKVKVDKIKKKFVRNLEKVNELWAKESTRPLLLMNSIQQLPLIEYLLADLLDPKKQTLRSKSPMKVVKKRLDNVVSKAKVKFIESRVKRAHQVRVRSTLFLKHFLFIIFTIQVL